MISCSLTGNYGGFTIRGTFDDFDTLYDSMSYFLDNSMDLPMNREIMNNFVLGFLYDLRHAAMGDREVYLQDNQFSEDFFEYQKVPNKLTHSVLLEFTYSVPDLIFVIVLMKFFIQDKFLSDINDYYFFEENYIKTFFSIVLDSLNPILTKPKIVKVKYALSCSKIEPKSFIKLMYLDKIVEYLNESKTGRKKMLVDLVSYLSRPFDYIDVDEYKKNLKAEAKKMQCSVDDLDLPYPEEIKW